MTQALGAGLPTEQTPLHHQDSTPRCFTREKVIDIAKNALIGLVAGGVVGVVIGSVVGGLNCDLAAGAVTGALAGASAAAAERIAAYVCQTSQRTDSCCKTYSIGVATSVVTGAIAGAVAARFCNTGAVTGLLEMILPGPAALGAVQLRSCTLAEDDNWLAGLEDHQTTPAPDPTEANL